MGGESSFRAQILELEGFGGIEIDTVKIDNREKISIQKMAYDYFDNIEIEQLPVGDFVCGSVCVERKSIADYTGSVNNNRIHNQAINMVSNYSNNSYIIVVGAIDEIYTNPYINGWTEARFDSEMALINASFPEISIEVVPTEKRFFKRMKALFKKCNDDTKQINEIKRIAPRSDNVYVDMVCLARGIGPTKAKAVLKQFKVHELWDVSEKDIQNSVKGVGKKQAAKIKEVFHR
jgi:ERCC4-type nuclease